MTKELRQAISLLQYSTIELTAFIQEQALENPLIELKEPSSSTLAEHVKEMREDVDEGGMIQDKNDSSPFDYLRIERLALSDYLIQQVRYLPLSKEELSWLYYFIYSIRDDGYLSRSLEDLQNDLEISTEEAEATLSRLQSLEPAGVGARSLQECLLLQLQRKKERDPLAETIVAHYMDLLAEKRWKQLSKELQVSLSDIQSAYDRIQQLDPRPGTHIGGEPTSYLIPDVTIEWVEGELAILLHDDYLPKISLNRQYQSLLLDSGNQEASQYVKQKYQQIQWLMKSIQQRQQTLLKVAEAILAHQRDFFTSKDGMLKPLTLREIAEEIGMHESTVSRATTNKYAQTPRGLFELKSFFSSSIQNGFGELTSSDSVKHYIKEVIASEEKQKPLSDQKIVSWLKEEKGITVSRRVIAKYRDELGIPSSNKRKRYE